MSLSEHPLLLHIFLDPSSVYYHISLLCIETVGWQCLSFHSIYVISSSILDLCRATVLCKIVVKCTFFASVTQALKLQSRWRIKTREGWSLYFKRIIANKILRWIQSYVLNTHFIHVRVIIEFICCRLWGILNLCNSHLLLSLDKTRLVIFGVDYIHSSSIRLFLLPLQIKYSHTFNFNFDESPTNI